MNKVSTIETPINKVAKPYTTVQAAETDDEEEMEYREPAFKFVPITDEQIMRVIRRTNPFKAPGSNEILNVVLKRCADILLPYLGPLFRATFSLQVYPEQWKNSKTLVLRKPGKC